MNNKIIKLIKVFPILLLIVASFIVTNQSFETKPVISTTYIGFLIVLVGLLVKYYVKNKDLKTRILIEVIFFVLTMVFGFIVLRGYSLNPFSNINILDDANLKEYTSKMIIVFYVFILNLLSYPLLIKQNYYAIVFVSAIFSFIACYGFKGNINAKYSLNTVFITSILLLFSKEVYLRKKEFPLKNIITYVVIILLLLICSSVFSTNFKHIKTPAIFNSSFLDDINLFLVDDGAASEEEARFIFDKYSAEITNLPFDAENGNVVLTYKSSVPINRLTVYVFDYYNPYAQVFVIEDIQDQGFVVNDIKSKANANIQDYYLKAIDYNIESSGLSDEISITSNVEFDVLPFPCGMDIKFDYYQLPLLSYEDKVIVANDVDDNVVSHNYKVFLSETKPYNLINDIYEKHIELNYSNKKENIVELSGENVKYYLYDLVEYLGVPEKIYKGIKEFVDKNKIDINKEPIEIIKQVEEIFDKNFIYLNDPPLEVGKEDPIIYFLNTSHMGYSRHFAAAKTMIYRYLNIPARFVLGYLCEDSVNEEVVVKQSDEYAWCEVLVNYNWTASDDLRLQDYCYNIEYATENEEYYTILSSETTCVLNSGKNIEHKRNEELINTTTKKEEKSTSQESNVTGGNGVIASTASNNNSNNSISAISQLINADGSINNSNIDDGDNETLVMFKCTDNEIDRLKVYSFGNYNYETSSFEYEDVNYYYDIDYDEIFLDSDYNYLDHKIIINSFVDTKALIVPYGVLSSDNLTAYYDRSIQQKEKEDAYSLSYRYNENNYMFTDSEYENYAYDKYLQVPEQLYDQLLEYLNDKGIDYTNSNKQQLIERIKYVLRNEYIYTTQQLPELQDDKDVVLYFLNESKVGKCNHFASSATLLFRVCGIPTRYVTGFKVSKYDKDGFGYCNANDVHAWVEVYDSSRGWRFEEVTTDFDIDTESSKPEDLNHDFIEPENKTNEIVDNSKTNDVSKSLGFKEIISKMLPVFVLLVIFTLIAILYKVGESTLTNHQKINVIAHSLKHNNHLSNESMEVLEKIHYSTTSANENDYQILEDNYASVIKKLGNIKSILIRIIRIYTTLIYVYLSFLYKE